MNNQPVGFEVFLTAWNQKQAQTTPFLHRRMARWLERRWQKGDHRLLLQAFRSSGKSTLTGLFACWLLYRNPDLRILVLAADLSLARKMIRNVRRITERHPLTKDLRPEHADEWGGDRFTVRRWLELRDPSMLAKGIGTNLTGTRADIIICDDVEVPNTCDTASKRADLRERLAELDFILVPGGTQLYIGTPHHWFSIYADVARLEINEARPFLGGFTRLSIPVVDDAGRSAWPERFGDADIIRIRAGAGPNKFASQMMLVPVNIAEGRLDPAQLVFYGDATVDDPITGFKMLGGRRLVACSAWWDPAFGNGGDASVLAIVFTDEDGRYHLHHLAYLKVVTDDPAHEQCHAVAQIACEFGVAQVTIETNGIGKFLPSLLRDALAAGHVACTVCEITSKRAKDTRILEAFDAVLAARALSVHESVRATPFIAEMQDWRPGGKGRDDGLDAVAGALSQAPLRQRRHHFHGRQGWLPGRRSYQARVDFDPAQF